VKRGHVGAIQLLGGGTTPQIRVEAIAISPTKAALGSIVGLAFELVSEGKKPQDLVVDYVVHYPGAKGNMRLKVWKLLRITLEPNERIRLDGRISLADRSIRKHHPGTYRIDLRIGGTDVPLGSFEAVVPKTQATR
jgi:hypothetical protein